MDGRLIENAYKLKIGRRRTRVTTYENLVLKTPKLQDTPQKTKQNTSNPSKYCEFNYGKRMKMRRQTIRELCNNNFETPNVAMVTLTFDQASHLDKDFKDIIIAHKEFDKFIRRIHNHYDDFRYIATFSRQRNGNWHYHMMCNFNNKINKKTISRIWKNGIVHITHLKDNDRFKTTIDYLIKNMNQSSDETRGRRGYLTSLNMEKEIEITSWKPQDTEEFQKAFEKVSAERRRILYETRNKVGVQRVEEHMENGDEVVDIIINQEITQTLKEMGYTELDTVYTYLSSSARFSDKFIKLVAATPKPTKRSNKK